MPYCPRRQAEYLAHKVVNPNHVISVRDKSKWITSIEEDAGKAASISCQENIFQRTFRLDLQESVSIAVNTFAHNMRFPGASQHESSFAEPSRRLLNSISCRRPTTAKYYFSMAQLEYVYILLYIRQQRIDALGARLRQSEAPVLSDEATSEDNNVASNSIGHTGRIPTMPPREP